MYQFLPGTPLNHPLTGVVDQPHLFSDDTTLFKDLSRPSPCSIKIRNSTPLRMSRKVGSFDTRLSSKGCLSCIRMKIKCDQTKPHCQRCLRGRRQCPGYRALSTLFVVQNGTGKLYTSAAPQPSAALATDWLQNAVNHYIRNFVIKPASGLPGFHAEVPKLYTYSADKTYLQSALQAVALTHLARMNRMGTDHLRRAQRLHRDAIQRLRMALSDDIEALSDSALVTTELLWQYDVITGTARSPTASPHREGMLQILHLRLQRGSSYSLAITKGAFVSIVLQDAGQINAPTRPTGPAMSMYPGVLPRMTNNLTCNLLGLVYEAVALCGDISTALMTYEEAVKYTTCLAQLDQDLLDWEGSLPANWWFSIQPRLTAQELEVDYPKTFLKFPSINCMVLWMSFWMARLDVLQCLDKLHPYVPQSPALWSDMALLVDRICAAIPHMTGQINQSSGATSQDSVQSLASVYAMRSLLAASQVRILPTLKKMWMQQQLQVIEQRNGIGQAPKPGQVVRAHWDKSRDASRPLRDRTVV